MITFATIDKVIHPKGGLIVEPPQEQDHILGASGPDFGVLVEDGQWGEYAPEPELQRNSSGDTYMCVSFSNNNISEFLIYKQYGELVNWSDIFLGKGSGTVRGRGNSKRTVAEWKRLNGYVLETDYPYTSTTTVDQAYAPLSATLLKKGISNLNFFTFNYKWLPDNSVQSLLNGLKLSPIQVDVEPYNFNDKGYISNSGAGYTHEVAIFGYESGKCWYVFDSESSQFLKFDWSYKFGSPMIHSVKKKVMTKLYKKNGSPAIYFLNPQSSTLVPYSDGVVPGGELFKIFFGDYSLAPIERVDELPFPVASYSITTINS